MSCALGFPTTPAMYPHSLPIVRLSFSFRPIFTCSHSVLYSCQLFHCPHDTTQLYASNLVNPGPRRGRSRAIVCGGTETMAQFRLVKLLSTDAAPARPLSLCSCFIHALKAHFLDS